MNESNKNDVVMIHFPPNTNKSLNGAITSFQDDLDNNIYVTSSSQWNDLRHSVKNIINRTAVLAGATERKASHVQINLKKNHFFITDYQISQRCDNFHDDMLKSWRFLGSNDRKHWTELDKQDDESFVVYCKSEIFHCKKGNYKYFRIASSGMICIKDIEIYGYLSNSSEVAVDRIVTCKPINEWHPLLNPLVMILVSIK